MKKRIETVLLSVIGVIISLFGFSVVWCMNTWRRLSMDELVYELSAPLKGTGSDMMLRFLVKCLLPTVVIAVIIMVVTYKVQKTKIIKWWVIVSAGFAILATVIFCKRLNVDEYLINMKDDSVFIENHYVDAGKAKLTFPEKKRNLIYIFLESMEITYSDIEDGGGFPYNTIPELTELSREYECFSGDDKINGAYAPSGATWTMGGMFAETSGLPLKILVEENSMSEESVFFPGATCIGDILEKEGYNQELLLGSEAVFGGRELYFASHGNYVMHDYNYALDNKIIPQGYHVFWGYEDAKLFENAKKDLQELSKKDEPFNLTMLTVDTHFPDGYACEHCKKKFGDNQYANVMACSSMQVADFINWVKKQDFYDNTTIVLCGDHTTMNETFCNDIPKDYERKVYSLVINSAVEKKRKDTISYSTLDMFPTTLAALGVEIEGNRLGLGTNLFSGEKTLIEEYGITEVNNQLKKNSAFMDSMSEIIDEELMREKGMLPDAEVGITAYDKATGTVTLKVDNLINVGDCKKVVASVYDVNMNEVGSYDMIMDDKRNYTCQIDISALADRTGTIVIEAIGKEKYKIGEMTGDLSIWAHENFGEYVDLLKAKDNIAILFAADGDFSSVALDKDLNRLRELGIDEQFSGQEPESFYGVVDVPSIAYETDAEKVSFDAEFMGNDTKYHLESEVGENNDCSIVIDGKEYALKEKGLNCVVYDYELGKVIDSACFDLSAKGEDYVENNINVELVGKDKISVSVKELSDYAIWNYEGLLWDKKHVNKPLKIKFSSEDDTIFTAELKTKGYDLSDACIEIYGDDSTHKRHRCLDWSGDILMLKSDPKEYFDYLSANMDDRIILMSSRDNMKMSEDKAVTDALNILGIEKFSQTEEQNAWYAVITKDGVKEDFGSAKLSCQGEYRGAKYAIKSAGWQEGFYSSIMLNGIDYSEGDSGINILVYNVADGEIEDIVTYENMYNDKNDKIFER
ncbi:MAG: sulfatase-like hydrolase/transferase [Butyrivibrio sp.]|nr:sulfatase-like hydrolase/transferase [Butyrivibrio sp.]